MTVTTTITCTPYMQAQEAVLHLHMPLKSRVLVLLDSMRSSGLFSCLELSALRQWEEESLHYFDHAGEEEPSLALCFLICDIIRPALAQEKLLENQDKLLAFEDAACALLVVPDGVSVDLYIDEIEELSRQSVICEERLVAIEAYFHRQIQQLYSSANATNAELVHLFTFLKQRLSALHAEREGTTHAMHQRLDALTGKVEGIFGALILQAEQIEQAGKQSEGEQRVFLQLLADCENALKKI